MIETPFKQAFFHSLPICLGYLCLGSAFALLMLQSGFQWYWAVLMSIVIYAGSMQFALVSLLAAQTPLWFIALMTVVINGRHLFYGIRFVELFKKMGWKYPYMIFSLTDETFSVLLGVKLTDEHQDIAFYIALFNHIYWISGTILGCILGNTLPIDMKGVEFSMTALFIVIVIEQWKQSISKLPFLIGGVTGLAMIYLFGTKYFLIYSLCCIIFLLVLFYDKKQGENMV
ncbi:branched-chain amino acid ABC transporter permease [Granulicatella sp. zg-ZJ]|uniref:AzlC family ABC transporter permease n=1 Tax=Granulicatella sp. zg-ZJ TaxID=2678504 RepID=UPI0013D074F0|nr:AzlC family ABC transporter permease [Granulicatella sp. zg-ZJ]NEW62627.1 branched-chain amino acid ABC transporter permease [Granulicatella sp. zg-ZJ]